MILSDVSLSVPMYVLTSFVSVLILVLTSVPTSVSATAAPAMAQTAHPAAVADRIKIKIRRYPFRIMYITSRILRYSLSIAVSRHTLVLLIYSRIYPGLPRTLSFYSRFRDSFRFCVNVRFVGTVVIAGLTRNPLLFKEMADQVRHYSQTIRNQFTQILGQSLVYG
ncbi:hypothetical protein R80B4_02457 [Fibrobacteres bacterium R8-0-B4]